MFFHPQHPDISRTSARRGCMALMWLCVALLLGLFGTSAMANQPSNLSTAGQIWFNPTTGIVEEILAASGGDTNYPIEYMWLYKTTAQPYFQGFSPSQNGLTLNIWQVGWQPGMVVQRCARRTICPGFVESNSQTVTQPVCPTLTVAPVTVPNGVLNEYYGPVVLTVTGGTAPYNWSMTGSLPDGLSWTQVGNEAHITGYPFNSGSYSFTFTATDNTFTCSDSQAYTVTVTNSAINLGDRVWVDTDKDGIQDVGESGLSGAQVRLLDSAGTTVLNTATTDSSGFFSFNYLSTGNYRIGIVPPANYLPTVANAAGSTEANDSDLISTVGSLWVTGIITLSGPNLDVDLGLAVAGDYGDLPVSFGTTGATAAYHTNLATLRLGLQRDQETNGSPNATATGDDTTGTPDDEDAITSFPTFTPGASATVSVSVLNNTGAQRRLFAFFDWNNNGSFEAGGETISALLVNTSAAQQTVSLSVPVPAGTTSGLKAARFRLSDQTTLAATGLGGAGEVEDYYVTVACPTITVSGPASLPAATVGYAYPSQTFTATGGSGSYTWTLTPAIPGLVLSSTGVLSGTPTTAGTYNSTVIATDTNSCSGSRAISLTVNACPSAVALLPGESYTLSAAPGIVSAFWLVNSGSGPVPINGANNLTYVVTYPAIYSWIGLDNTGCVVEGCCPVTFTGAADFGDLADGSTGTGAGNYQTLISDNGPGHFQNGNLRLGVTLDTETNGQPSAAANGDGTDEDGITAMPSFGRGAAFSIPVSVFNNTGATARVFGFIDWNNDGDFGDASEVLTPVAVTTGASQQSVNVTGSAPVTAELTAIGARFRLSTATTLTAVGMAANGEVEDYSVTVSCPTLTWTPATLPSAVMGVNYNLISGTQVTATGSAAITGYTLSGAPAWLSINSSGQLAGTPPAAATGVTFTVNATDANGCTGSRAYTINVANLCAGNLVFIDMNNDGVRQSTEAGVPNLALQIWNAGADGVRGGGNDTLTASTTTDWNGAYQFSGLAPASYFIRIATPPVYHPQVAAGGVNLDNGLNTDHNAIQPGGSGTEVFSPVFALSAGTEPAAGVDGDGTDCDSTIDFGFANVDPCYVTANNKFANPSFEVQGLPNTTGTGAALLGYNGTGTPSQSANQNAFQWVGGVNGTSGVGEPVQGVQIQATAGGGSVAWVESMKARHGRRMMLLQNTGAGVAMRPASGTWSTQLVAGGEYQLSVWAANASASSAGILWSLAATSGQVIQVISGAAPGFYQSYSVPQSEMTGTPTPGFTSADYTATNWSEATANSAQPTWRQYTYQFRINPAATAAEIDGLGIVLGAAASSGPVVVDHVALCAVNIPPTLVLGGTIWNDNNNDGQLAAETAFAAGVISGITLYKSTNTIVGDADDVVHATGATLAPSGLFNYRFTNLPAGNYYVQFTPPATSARSGGTPVNLDNNINNDNNGVQPGAPGTQIRTPMITLAAGTEPVNDGDTNPDTNYSADIGLWSGFTLGDQIWIDTNGNGTFENGTDSVSGLTTVNVELLDSLNAVVATTQPNTSGQYSFSIYTAGSYRVRLPVPPATAPLLALNSVTLDNGANNDNNGTQPGLQGSAITSATITLTAGAEPPPSGVTNTDNTLDIGVRPCPAFVFTPSATALPVATVGTNYNSVAGSAISSTGGSGGYVYTLGAGSPAWMSIDSASGQLSGVPTAPGTAVAVNVVSTDNKGCSSSRAYTLTINCPAIAIANGAAMQSVAGTAYTQVSGFSATSTAALNAAGYAWTLVTPPAGMSIGGADGRLTIANTVAAGLYSLNVRATTNAPYTACAQTQPASFRVCPMITVTLADTNAFVGRYYNRDLAVANATTSTLSYTLASGALPAWATLNATTGKISGLPNNTTSATFAIRVTDSNGCTAVSPNYTITPVCPPLHVARWRRLDMSGAGFTKTAIDSVSGQTVADLGTALGNWRLNGTGLNVKVTTTSRYQKADLSFYSPYEFATTSGTMWLGQAGGNTAITYTFTQPVRTYSYMGGALQDGEVDSFGPTAVGGIISSHPVDGMTVLDDSAANYTAGSLGNFADEDAESFTWVMTGTSTTQTTTLANATRWSNGNHGLFYDEDSFPLVSPLTLAGELEPGVVNSSYAQKRFSVMGAVAPVTWSLFSGSLPTGLSLTTQTDTREVVLGGTPTIPGTYTFTLRATDSYNCTGDRTYTIKVTCPTITVADGVSMMSTNGSAYTQTTGFSASSALGGSYTWSLDTPPAGFTIGSTDGRISVANTVAVGLNSLTVRATSNNAPACAQTKAVNFRVCPVFGWTPATLPAATVGVSYSSLVGTQMTATGSAAIVSYTLSGAPAWMSITNAGQLQGTPTAGAASTNFTIIATDANGCVGSTTRSVAVSCPAISIADGTPLMSTTTAAFTQATGFTASGNAATNAAGFAWSLVSPPVGVTIGASDGKLTVASSVASAVYSITVRATGNAPYAACSQTKTVNFRVCPVINVTLPSTAASVAVPYSRVVSATGGTGPYIFALNSGSLPAWATLDANTGLLSGQPNNTVSSTFTLRATDMNGCVGVSPTYIITPAVNVDFGDWAHASNPNGAAASGTYSFTDANLRIGAIVDADTGVTPNATATGDDTTGSADEDSAFHPSRVSGMPGVVTPITVGSEAQLSVKATNLSAAPAYLNAWIDFDNSGTFDVGEQIATNLLVPAGTTDYVPDAWTAQSPDFQFFRLQFNVPLTASVGNARGVRVRLSDQLNTLATGPAGNGEVEDHTINIAAAMPCYHFRIGDANNDRYLPGATETQPVMPYDMAYTDNAANMGYIKQAEMTYHPASRLFTLDAAFQQFTPSGPVRVDGFWFVVNGGPFGLPGSGEHAIVYIDTFNRANPKVTIYVDEINTHGTGWQTPGKMLLSSVSGGLNASDVKVLSVKDDAGLLQIRLTLDATRVNDRASYPAHALPTSWRGLEFAGTAGLWLRAVDLTAEPLYTGSGALGSWSSDANNYLEFESDPAAIKPLVVEGCFYDFGDHFFFPGLSAANTPSTLLKLGANATDAEGDFANLAADIDDLSSDDEDLVMPSGFPLGANTVLTVPVTMPSPASLFGGAARVSMWVDWNGDGDVSDAGEGIGTQPITVTGGVSFNISPPAGTLPGTKYMRLRAVEGVTAATFSGVSTQKGEVEDYAVQVPCPAITIVDGAALLSTTGTSFTQATGFAASGVNTGGFTWSLVSPPSGFSIGSADGKISVASSVAAGVYSVPVRATAASFTSCSQDKTVGFRVCPIFTWTPASLPNAVVGQDYNSIAGNLITATGSAAIVNYSLSGAPAWLSITNAGQLQGTPTASAGPVSFTINATDANGCTGSTTRSITVSCPAFTMNNGTLMLSTTGIAYTQASGFTVGSNTALNSAGYFWSLVTPPSGFSIGATDGKLTVGNVVPAGVYTLNVRATAASPYATCFADRAASYRVCPVFTWTPASLPTATVGVNYGTVLGTQISATGSAAITSYSLSGAPSWLSITSTGQLQGTPNSSAAAATFTITATDANGCSASTTRSIAVTCPALTPLPAAGTLATAYQFQPYATTTFSTSGTSQSITHTVGGTAPSGMTWSVVSNVPTLTGTPLVTGSFNLSVTAAHGGNCSTTTNYTLVVNACPVLAVSPSSLNTANLGLSYNQGANFSATGGSGSLNWLMEPAPQAGLVSQWGMENSVLDLIDTNEGYTQGSATYTLGKIGQSLNLDGVDDGAIIADALTQRPASAITLEAWVFLDAAAPSGRRHLIVKTNTSALTNGYGLCQESGTSAVRFWINGVNTVLLVSENVQATLTTGTWNHVVGTYDRANLRIYVNGVQSATKAFTVAMNHSLQALRFGGGLAAGDRFDGRLDEAALYSTALSAAQVTARYNASNNVAGLLPTGLSFNSATPAIAGTAVLPSTAGNYPFRMRATDANGCFGLRDYTLTLTCPAITVATAPAMANGTVGTVYATRTFTASGGMEGAGGYNWTSTALPPGLTLTKINTTQATLTGTPTTAGIYSFTITATDANNCTGQSAFSNIAMNCPALAVTNGVLMLNTTGAAYTQTTGFTVSSGNALDSAGYTWSLVSPPAGFTIGSADGKLTIASSVASNAYNLTVRATPNAPYATCFTDRAVTYRVCPVFTWTPASLPAATAGVNISTVAGTKLTATSSSAIINYSLSGAPAWLSIDSTGQLQGTPTASAASASFTITATDTNGCTGSTTRSIVVNCPAISVLDGSLMLSTTGTTYTQATGFSANSNPSLNTAGYGWSLVTPPTGFSIGATNGRLTVANTVAAGLYSLSVRATANAPYSTCLQTQATNYRVCPVFTWAPATLPNAPVGVNYNTVLGTQVTATGSAAITSYTITGGPAWLSINNSGVLSGTPPAAATAVTFTVNAFDANNCAGSNTYTIDAVPVDYGDYPAFGAASQIAGTTVFIGSNATDGEMTSPSTGAATVDDTTGTDDEDLVMPVVLTNVGAQPVFTIPVTLAGGVTAGRIGAWIDWNGDNDVADTNETVTLSTVNLVAGLNTITATLNPPLGTLPGDKFLRIRVAEGTTMPALSGLSYLRGEVEDYVVQVRSPLVLFGMEQRSNTGIPAAQSAVPSTYLAPCVTSQPLALYSGAGGVEFNGLVVGEDGNPEGTLFPNITITTGRQLRSASGWDTTLDPGLQTARSSLTPTADSAPFTFSFGGVTPDTVISGFALNCARMSGAPNQVQVYLTWHDGTAFRTAWTSPVVLPESYYSGTPPVGWQTVLMDGFTNGATLPSGAALSNTTFLCEVYAFGGTGSLMIDNVTLLGTSVCAITDLGDWAHATNPSGAATATATSVVNSTLRLGATVDAEFIVTAGAAATWDDATNNGSADDEDGVTMPASIAAGASVTIPVSFFNNNTAGRYLKGWIDFNNDGVFNDVDVATLGGERISNLLTNANAAQQSVNVNFTVPVGASVGSARGVRFRISDNVATSPVSSGAAGETEDYVVNIACPVISIADGTLMLHTTGAAYTQATGFSATSVLTGGYNWSLVTPPAGFSIGSADGKLTVASSVPVGVHSVTVRAASLGNVACLQDKTASYRVCPIFTWNPASLPNAVVGQNYNSIGGTAITATGSAAIVNYTLTGAPSWLSITSAGQLQGTPTASAASATFTINATDANGCTGSTTRSVTVVCPTLSIANGTLMLNTTGTAYTQATGFAASSNSAINTAGYAWSLVTPPAGFTIGAADGKLSIGNTVANGLYNLSVRATANAPYATCAQTTTVSYRVCPIFTWTPASLPNAVVGQNYNSIGGTVIAATGSAAIVNYSLTGAPSWLSITSAGQLQGTPTASAASATFTINATDANGCTGSTTRTVTVVCPTLTITDGTLMLNTTGTAYTQATGFAATSNAAIDTAGYAWSLVTPPAGFTIGAADGKLTIGNTVVAGLYSLSVRATANAPYATCAQTKAASYRVCPIFTWTPASLPNAVVGQNFNSIGGTAIAATGSAAIVNYTLSGAPPWLSITSAGQLQGTPTASAASATFTINATDANGCTGSTTRSVTVVCPAITIADGAALMSTTGTAYTQATGFAASSNAALNAAGYTWSLVTPPSGFTIGTTDGKLSVLGSVVPGLYSLTPSATANSPYVTCAQTKSVSYRVCPVLNLPASLPDAPTNINYNTIAGTSVAVTNGTGPYVYSLTGNPAWLSVTAAGQLQGTPTSPVASVTFTVNVTDSGTGCQRSQPYTISVRGLTVGDIVFEDSDNDGLLDAGEPGVAGALVQIFSTGTDNAIGGSGGAADTQIGSNFTTTSTGAYSFSNLAPGNYYIRLTPPSVYPNTGGTPVTADNNVNGNNDGSQPGGPGGVVFSPVFNLALGAETNAAGATNTDINATIDFGLWNSISIGNVVFQDINADGTLDVNEGLESVLVFAYTQGSTVGVTTPAGVGYTDNKGRYLITGLNPGSYFLHIPASQFASGMPLQGLVPMSSVVAGDDHLGQDLLAAATPATTGASTAVFSVRPGLAPSGSAEAGFEASSDDATDTLVDLTRDLGFVNGSGSGFAASAIATNTLPVPEAAPEAMPEAETAAAPLTFATWTAQHEINGAAADADGDSAPNLLEYALGTDPRSGIVVPRFELVHDVAANAFDAVLTRPVDGGADIRVMLEAAASLDEAAWKPLALPAAANFNQDGTVTRRYAGVDAGPGSQLGFVRLRVDLDADKDGLAESTVHSAALAWTRQTFATGTRTFSMPLLAPAAYIGSAQIRAESITLPESLSLAHAPHYVEVLDGPHAGLRLEIDLVEGFAITLQTTAPASLASARIAVRPHHRIATLLPAAHFSMNADTVRFLDAGAFATIPLTATGWSIDRILHPHEAALVTLRGEQPVTLVFTGEVRATASTFRIPLVKGTQLITTGWPQHGTVPSKDLRSASVAENADRLRIWNGDHAPAANDYSSYYLDSASGWTPQSEPAFAKPDLQPFHGIFLLRDTALEWKP